MSKTHTESAHAHMSASITKVAATEQDEQAHARGHYAVECLDADGNVKWSDVIENIVVNQGKNFALDTLFAGSAYTAAVVMGLKGTGTAVVGDTQASHASWLEVGLANAPAYSGTRKTPAFSAASAGSKQTSSAVSFAFTSGGTVAGCFINLAGSATQDTTTGNLYSAGDFTGGSKVVASGDTVQVTWTGSL